MSNTKIGHNLVGQSYTGCCPDAFFCSLPEIRPGNFFEQAIRDALKRNEWKRVVTARELGIDKNTLRRKIKRLSILEPD
jgi:transcriptional regulator of acetoin/glycerol metabolism